MPVRDELSIVDRAYSTVLQRQLVTSVGVAPGLLKELNNEDVELLLTYSGTLEDMSKWTVADLMVWGEMRAHQETGCTSGKHFWEVRDGIWDQLLAACKMDIAKGTAYNMVATAKAFPWERRRHTRTLSFEHHRLLSGREDGEQDHWLDLAEAGEWSVSKLRMHLYSHVDPLTPSQTVMSAPRDAWPVERVEREVYDAFALPTRWDTVERVKMLVIQIKEEVGNVKKENYPR